METHDSTVPYYLESKTKKFMSNFRDMDGVFQILLLILIYLQMMKTKMQNGHSFT